uniref:Uncharacterized protein n=1 Tax=Arundo donax TaxID=35708 RepID=A0A0A8ZV32_ARUDO
MAAAAILRCATAIAIPSPAAAAVPLRHHPACLLGAVRLRLSFHRIPPPRRAAAAMSSSAAYVADGWYAVPGLSLRDHRFAVPLDHFDPDCGASITVFAREVVAAGKEDTSLPYLLYLQGGPGFESPRPMEAGGWIKKACEDYRVVLLDQRGTGLSTPLTTSSLAQITSATEQVEYLKHFRADNIVKDAEFIRLHLVPDAKPWTVLGQVCYLTRTW